MLSNAIFFNIMHTYYSMVKTESKYCEAGLTTLTKNLIIVSSQGTILMQKYFKAVLREFPD